MKRGVGVALGISSLVTLVAACSFSSEEQWGPVIPIGKTVTTSTARFDLVSLRCNPTTCVIFQKINRASGERDYIDWTESVLDSDGVEYSSGNSGLGSDLFAERVPPGVQHPTFAEFPLYPFGEKKPLPDGRTIVKVRLDDQVVVIGPVTPSASQGTTRQWSDSYGTEVPIGKTVTARTPYGDFTVELVSLRCSSDACEVSERDPGLDPDPNWWQYPVFMQKAVDTTGAEHSPPVCWPGVGPNWDFSPSAPDDEMTPFTVVYVVPAGRHLVAVKVPGVADVVPLPRAEQ